MSWLLICSCTVDGIGGWYWRRVASILREASHEVFTPTLTGLGERAHLLSPEIDLGHSHSRHHGSSEIRRLA